MEATRGTPPEFEEFLETLRSSVEKRTFVRLTLGKYRGTEPPERIVAVPVVVRSEYLLSFKLRYGPREETKNVPLAGALELVREHLGTAFRAASLFTTERDTTIQFSRKGVPAVRHGKPTSTAAPSMSINREKQYLVTPSEPFLELLGITTSDGRVKADKFDKFRQINKFVEIVDALVKSSGVRTDHPLTIVDFGSGKHYLTFALHHHLTKTLGRSCTTVGVEARAPLVEQGNAAARTSNFDTLSFVSGDIASFELSRADIVVALHACDTATDDALAKGIAAGASIIAVAPCCQKYVRPRMQLPADVAPIFKHGITQERFAEHLTNGLRALVLEAHGYDAKVFEFITGEHTAKNIMITATRRRAPAALDERTVSEIARLRSVYGLSDFYLDTLSGMLPDTGTSEK